MVFCLGTRGCQQVFLIFPKTNGCEFYPVSEKSSDRGVRIYLNLHYTETTTGADSLLPEK